MAKYQFLYRVVCGCCKRTINEEWRHKRPEIIIEVVQCYKCNKEMEEGGGETCQEETQSKETTKLDEE